jgi:hypothetical protein
MKLKKFAPVDTHRKKNTVAAISLNVQVGSIRISQKAAELLAIKEDDFIEFAKDEDTNAWFVCKSDTGFKIRTKSPTAKDSSGHVIQSTHLVREIFEAANFVETSGRCIIGTEPVDIDGVQWFEIITLSLKKLR